MRRLLQFRNELVILWRAFLAPETPAWLKGLMLLIPACLLIGPLIDRHHLQRNAACRRGGAKASDQRDIGACGGEQDRHRPAIGPNRHVVVGRRARGCAFRAGPRRRRHHRIVRTAMNPSAAWRWTVAPRSAASARIASNERSSGNAFTCEAKQPNAAILASR